MKRVMEKTMKNTAIALVSIVTVFLTANLNAAEYLVKYRSQYGIMSFSDRLQVADIHPAGNLMKVNIAEPKTIEAMIELFSNPNVEYVVPNAKLYAFTAPVDVAGLKDQWAIAKVQAEKAWQRAGNKGSKRVVVAVIDTGVDYKHKALASNSVPGYNFIQNNNDPMDITGGQNPGHGTHCAGIIGSNGLVDGGTIGISPEVSIMPLRFLDENGSGDLNNGVKAIDYAIEKGVDVISASWGAAVSRAQAQPLIDAIERARAKNIIFVVAAANDGKNNDSYEVYPANAGNDNTISVAAMNMADAKPSWSNYGKHSVHLSSPGDTIMSTLPGNRYGNLSGTSMATPLVAGLVAFIKAQDSTLKPYEIRSLLQATGVKIGIETACDCRVDAFNAVDMVLSKQMYVHPFSGTFAPGEKVNFTGIYGKAPFTFTSSNASAATIDSSGVLTAVAEGETQISVTDADGKTASSYKIYVANKSDDGGGGGGGGGECPIGDPQMCEIMCQIMPTLPFCNK